MTFFRGESTVEEIRARFDADVERFSNLETGQSAAIDAPLALELITQAATCVQPAVRRVLDLGCGAGNFSLRLLQRCPGLEEITLVDLSLPMLTRARERLLAARGDLSVTLLQGDLREVPFEKDGPFDVILAGAVLHHLRSDDEWDRAFARIYEATRPGGSCWIFDLVTHAHPAVQQMFWQRYGEYLTALQDEAYRDRVFDYALQEDSPRSLPDQLTRLARAGFQTEVLHANGCFAAFGGIRPSLP